jgi:hypothetical protein
VNPLHATLGIAVIFCVLFLFGALQAKPDPAIALRDRYLRLTRFPRAEAEAHLAQRLEALCERFPGKSYRWYLQWLVMDLQKAKR